MLIRLLTAILLAHFCVQNVNGHGRLIDPPSRSSMWRFGFPVPPNYNDNELFCGGYTVHYQRNGGKCGICGDPWHQKEPRDNEAGGKYARGIISRTYKAGDIMNASVDLTANHKGYFEFKACPNNNPKVEATQECLDNHRLPLADGSGYKYYLPTAKSQTFVVPLRIPEGLTCTQCVFQWTYTAGNNWGPCQNGEQGVGCGPQETFRNCADIRIDPSGRKGSSDTEPNPEENEIGGLNAQKKPDKPNNSNSVHHYNNMLLICQSALLYFILQKIK